MQPIIRHTITITITETWTITWPDGQETVWEKTGSWPDVSEANASGLLLIDANELPDADAVELLPEDE